VEDDELTRARRALRGVDPEIDLARVYAQARARTHGTDEHDDWATDELVEIVLRDTSSGARRTRPRVPRGRVLVWGAAAAAAAALVVSVAGLPAQRATPGSAPSTSVSATMDATTPVPAPTVGLTPAGVVRRAAQAVAEAGCGVKTRSTLGNQSSLRFDDAGATDTATPKPAPLAERPLEVLEAAAAGAALDLSALQGAGYRLHDEVTLDEEGGETLARVQFTPPPGLVDSGEVSRIELLVDLTTWLPHTQRTSAESDDGGRYLLLSEFTWTSCGEPSPTPGAADTRG
jgi:hypothetical protein